MYYAELDKNGICCAVTCPAAPLVGSNFIALASRDLTVLGKQYLNGVWITP